MFHTMAPITAATDPPPGADVLAPTLLMNDLRLILASGAVRESSSRIMYLSKTRDFQ